MKISKKHEQLASACGGPNNPRTRDLRNSLRSFGSHPGSQPFSPARGSARSDSGLNRVLHLSRIVESVPCSAVIEERNRLAREIHDTLVQEFAGILLNLEAANGLALTIDASECLARARELAKSGLEDARRMLLGLRPKSLEGADFSDALRQLAERFSRDCGIHCVFSATGRQHKLTEEIEDELYRVAQEALCNVRKHSRAGSVSILLSYASAGVVLAIKDDGQGFAMRRPKPGAHGFGLPAMCERASRLGGRMDINSGQGTGTEIRMSVPLSGNLQRKGTTNESKFNNDGGPDQSPSSCGG
jgi:signal transduction histidine kinase